MTAVQEFSVQPALGEECLGSDRLAELLHERPSALRDRAVMLIAELLAGVSPGGVDQSLTVRVISDGGTVRVEVRDGGQGIVVGSLRQASRPEAARGWSPHMLSSVAERWGLVSAADGAWVWFELDVDPGDRA